MAAAIAARTRLRRPINASGWRLPARRVCSTGISWPGRVSQTLLPLAPLSFPFPFGPLMCPVSPPSAAGTRELLIRAVSAALCDVPRSKGRRPAADSARPDLLLPNPSLDSAVEWTARPQACARPCPHLAPPCQHSGLSSPQPPPLACPQVRMGCRVRTESAHRACVQKVLPPAPGAGGRVGCGQVALHAMHHSLRHA